jgi:hypothetical protein
MRVTFPKERRALFGYDKKAQIGHDPSFRSLLERICWSKGECQSRPWRLHLYAFSTQRIRLTSYWTARREGHLNARQAGHLRKTLKQPLKGSAA